MDRFILSACLFVVVAAVSTQAAPQFQHLYLGYVSPFDFLKGFNNHVNNYAFQQFRPKRSAMGDYHPNTYHPMAHHDSHDAMHHDAMPYGYSFGYNPMTYPFKMYSFPKFPQMSFPKFPDMHHFPAMPKFNFPSYNPYHNIMPSSNIYNNMGYKPSYQPAVSNPAASPHYSFGNDFMKMMGFNFNKVGNNHPVNHNNHNNNGGAYRYNNAKQGGHAKGNNYDMSYSKSYSMNMDYTNGKGHMVTKEDSIMNDNGKIYQHTGPARHFVDHGNGKFVADNGYSNMHH